jgi:hypothetical protein
MNDIYIFHSYIQVYVIITIIIRITMFILPKINNITNNINIFKIVYLILIFNLIKIFYIITSNSEKNKLVRASNIFEEGKCLQ